ncbi:hypothetical protein G3M48_003103 [Beauveria asiatica]|uniref:Uncharacterized protein n=1 Tax=Beauveria asiatica TaxID=1069075 RepID=A0AAW0S7Q4_9HYPO
MLTLSLLLSAAAGVNAILGGDVSSVMVTETSFFCADDCVFGGAFFGQGGYFCPEREIIARLDDKGNDDPNFPFDCIGMEKEYGFTFRQRSSGEEPRKCPVSEASALNKPDECLAYKGDGSGSQTVQWSDIEKELKAAAPPKSQQECAKDGREIFAKCRAESGAFVECNKKATAAIKSCRGLQ